MAQTLGLERNHAQRHRGRGHSQTAQQGYLWVLPKIKSGTVGNGKRCQGTKYCYAPTTFNTFYEIVGIFLKPQGKHNGDNAQLGKVDNKYWHFGGQNAQIN